MRFTSYVVVSWVGALIFLLTAWFAWRQKFEPGGAKLVGMLLALAEWSLALGFENATPIFSAKIFWAKMGYVGAVSAAPVFLLFCLDYSYLSTWLSRWKRFALWVIPVVALILVWTNDHHFLFWKKVVWETSSGNTFLSYEYGVFFYVLLVFLYLCIFVSMIILYAFLQNSSAITRRQTKIILLAAILSMVGIFTYETGLRSIAVWKFAILAVILIGTLLAGSVAYTRALALPPVARSLLIDDIFDGVLVLDLRNRIVDINVPAVNMLRLEKPPLGQDVFEVLQHTPLLAATLVHKPKMDVSVQLFSEPQRFVEVRMSPLAKTSDRVAGYVAILRDVTEQKQMEVALKEQTFALSLQANTDDLTGLFNRRFAGEILTREFNRSKRYNLPLTVSMFDIDDFKVFNDTYGHAFGDACLRQVAKELLGNLRSSDVAARMGGDEFLVIFPNTDLPHAVAALERLRRRLAAVKMDNSDVDTLRISISVGVTLRLPEDQPDDILLRADKLLYRAKDLGKNQIVVDSF